MADKDSSRRRFIRRLQGRQHTYMKKNTKIILTVLIIILAVVFAVSAYKLISTLHEYKVADNMYSNLNNRFVSGKTADAEDDADKEHSPISVDFDELLAQSPDVVGWIYSADTPINYPVVQGEDNDFYLHRFMDGTWNPSGTIFLDIACEGDFTSRNTIIYGHHMNDGSMFASLSEYRKQGQDYYDQHSVMYLNTPTQNYKIEVFAGILTDAESDVYAISFSSEESFTDYIQRMKAQSVFESPVEVQPEDNIVTLSTCAYDFENARFVILGRLVPIA